MDDNQNSREEAKALARPDEAQLKALQAFDVIEKAVQSAGTILEPLRRLRAPEDGRGE